MCGSASCSLYEVSLSEVSFWSGSEDHDCKHTFRLNYKYRHFFVVHCPQTMCPRTKSLECFSPLDDESHEICVPWSMRPLVDASLTDASQSFGTDWPHAGIGRTVEVKPSIYYTNISLYLCSLHFLLYPLSSLIICCIMCTFTFLFIQF